MKALGYLVTVAALVFVGASCIGEARASPPGVAEALTVGASAPAASAATYVDSFTVACAATATLIQSSGGAQIGYACQTPASAETAGTVLVAVGDSAIADPAFATRNSPVYSGDTVRSWDGDAKLEYCRADTGTVTIFCRAFIAVSVAP